MAAKHCLALLSVLVLLIEPSVGGDYDYEELKQKVELPAKCGGFSGLLRFHNKPNRVSSGYEARKGQFPSYVQLYCPRSGRKISRCGGTIISKRHILTAAHCLNATLDGTPIRVATGIGGVQDSDRRFESERLCVSPSFSHPARNRAGPHSIYDVGIIRLKESIKFDSRLQPACFPSGPLQDGTQAYAIGLGGVGQDSRTKKLIRPTRLQVLPVARTGCDQWSSHESVMCARFNNPIHRGMVCHGDSGGPVLALDNKGRQTVYGISSFGAEKCEGMDDSSAHVSGYFVDVFNLRPEIDRLLKECS